MRRRGGETGENRLTGNDDDPDGHEPQETTGDEASRQLQTLSGALGRVGATASRTGSVVGWPYPRTAPDWSPWIERSRDPP